jgi:hypothetical protein
VSISRYHHRVHRPGNTGGLIIKHATAQSARTGFNRLCSTGLAANADLPRSYTLRLQFVAAVRGRSRHMVSWTRRSSTEAQRAAGALLAMAACSVLGWACVGRHRAARGLVLREDRYVCACALCVLQVPHVCVLMNGVRGSDPPCRGILGILTGRAWVDAIPAFGAAMSTDDLSRQIKWLRKHNAAKSTPSASDALSSLPSLSPSLAPLAPPPAPALSPADYPSEADGDHAAKDRGPSWLLQVFCRSSCARGHLLGRKYWRRKESARGCTGCVHVGNTRA